MRRRNDAGRSGSPRAGHAAGIAGTLLCGLLCVAGVRAQVPDTVFLEELTSSELADRVRVGATSVIVPIGGTEQNGPYMALGKHNVRVKLLSEKIARAVGATLVAPVIAYVPEGGISPPTGHMGFPGTITVPDAAFQGILTGAAESLRLHGFRAIFFLGDHGGYQAQEQAVAQRLDRQWSASPARAYAIVEYYRATQEGYVEALRRRGYADAEIGTHAGLADTSLTLALAPGLVRMERLRAGPKPGPGNGVHGDPSRSTAELGVLGVDAVVARTVAAIKNAIAHR